MLTLWTNEQERAEAKQLEAYAHIDALPMPRWRSLWNCVKALPTNVPLQSVFSWHPELVAGLNGRSPFDVIHVEHLRGAHYGLHLKAHTRSPVVWDSVDCITHLFQQTVAQSKDIWRRWRSRFDLNRTRHYEGWLLSQFDRVLVTSAVDRKALMALPSNKGAVAPVEVIANGVDLDYFRPNTAVVREPATLVISGKMSYHANITMTLHLVNNIMPHVWARRPDVKVWVVGKDPTREIQALDQHTAVTVTGTVDDIRPYLCRATAAVAPLTYGAGVQNKVLEAMACATPVITTPKAISALDLVFGRDVIVAQEPHLFAEAILKLLDSPAQQQQVGQAGHAYVQTHHHWSAIVAQLEKIYLELIHGKKTPPSEKRFAQVSLSPRE